MTSNKLIKHIICLKFFSFENKNVSHILMQQFYKTNKPNKFLISFFHIYKTIIKYNYIKITFYIKRRPKFIIYIKWISKCILKKLYFLLMARVWRRVQVEYQQHTPANAPNFNTLILRRDSDQFKTKSS